MSRKIKAQATQLARRISNLVEVQNAHFMNRIDNKRERERDE